MPILHTELIQTSNGVDAGKLFDDVNNELNNLYKKNGWVYAGRHCELERILSRFGGRYISPSNMKSFLACPCGSLINTITPREPGTATSVGTSVHSVLQQWYDLPKGERTLDAVWNLVDQVSIEDKNDKDQIANYVQGYLDSPDYLNIEQEMNHNDLECFNEVFYKQDHVNVLGAELPAPLYCLIDRVDIRDEGIYVVDYKTGKYFNREVFGLNGYLPQMICYKWVVENSYGVPVQDVLLSTPGSTQHKYVKMDVHSLYKQSVVVDKIYQYMNQVNESKRTLFFPQKQMQYCNGCAWKDKCSVFNQVNSDNKIPVDLEWSVDVNEVKTQEQQDEILKRDH